jgi:hypothetical protein
VRVVSDAVSANCDSDACSYFPSVVCTYTNANSANTSANPGAHEKPDKAANESPNLRAVQCPDCTTDGWAYGTSYTESDCASDKLSDLCAHAATKPLANAHADARTHHFADGAGDQLSDSGANAITKQLSNTRTNARAHCFADALADQLSNLCAHTGTQQLSNTGANAQSYRFADFHPDTRANKRADVGPYACADPSVYPSGSRRVLRLGQVSRLLTQQRPAVRRRLHNVNGSSDVRVRVSPSLLLLLHRLTTGVVQVRT